MIFQIKTAGLVFEVQCLSQRLRTFCGEYLVDTPKPDHRITIIGDDIRRQREELLKKETENSRSHSDHYLETLVLQQKIAELLAEKGGFLLHGSVVAWQGSGYVFAAPSGTGKTTHSLLWKQYLGEEAAIVNGDKPFIRADQAGAIAYGTPWCGKEHFQINTSVPIKTVCFLRQAAENRIRPLSAREALPFLYPQVWFPQEPRLVGHIMESLGRMLEGVSLWQMDCNASQEAFKTGFQAMTGEQLPP